jgi:hypothetical protein
MWQFNRVASLVDVLFSFVIVKGDLFIGELRRVSRFWTEGYYFVLHAVWVTRKGIAKPFVLKENYFSAWGLSSNIWETALFSKVVM